MSSKVADSLFEALKTENEGLLKGRDEKSLDNKKELKKVRNNFKEVYKAASKEEKIKLKPIGKFIDLTIKSYKDPSLLSITNLNNYVKDNNIKTESVKFIESKFDTLKEKETLNYQNTVVLQKNSTNKEFGELANVIEENMPDLSKKLNKAESTHDKAKVVKEIEKEFKKMQKGSKSSTEASQTLKSIENKINSSSSEYSNFKDNNKKLVKQQAKTIGQKLMATNLAQAAKQGVQNIARKATKSRER